MIRRVLLAGLTASLVFVAAAQAAGAAGTLYGSYNTPPPNPTTSTLSTVNVGTGSATAVGTLPFSPSVGVTEIVCQPNPTSAATAICYAQASGSARADAISQFNLSTGAAIGAPVPDGAAPFNGLAYVGSTLYGASQVLAGPSTLSTLNPVTGASVVIGLTGVGPITGLAWNGTTMYAIEGTTHSAPGAHLYTINLSTGAATLVGATGIEGAGSLQFGPDGNLYAGGDNTDGGHLYRVNQTTGAATLVGASGFLPSAGLTGLALVTFPNPAPPTPPLAPAAITVTPSFTG